MMLRMYIRRKLEARDKKRRLEAVNHALLLNIHHELGQLHAKLICTVPPPGWTCSRVAGHDGPCAASPVANAHAAAPSAAQHHESPQPSSAQLACDLEALDQKVRTTTTTLLASEKKNQPPKHKGVLDMAGSPPAPATDVASVLARLTADITAETNAVTAAETLLTTLNAQLAAAIAASKAAGLTDDQLASFNTLLSASEANVSGLAAGVAANTPAAPATPTA